MELERSIIKGGRLGSKKTLGMMIGNYVLYENLRWSMSYTSPSISTVILPIFNTDFKYTSSNKTNTDSTVTTTITASNEDDWPISMALQSDYVTSVDSIADTYGMNDMSYMFYECPALKSINLSEVDTSNVTTMSNMFFGCEVLTSLDLLHFRTSKVTDMSSMFHSCSKLTDLDLSSFDTSNVTNFYSMFQGSVLKTLNLSNFTISETANVNNMFHGCTRLYELRLDNCDATTISKIINSNEFPTGTVSGYTRTIYCKQSVVEAADLAAPDPWVFSYVAEEVEEPEEEIPLYTAGEFKGTDVTEVKTMVDSSYTDLSNMFSNCTNLVSVNTDGWDTSNVSNMYNMFNCCYSLTELDLSSFDTGNVTNMMYMFYYCNKLEKLNISNWEVRTTTKMTGMFDRCSSLRAVHLENCDYNTLCAIFNVLPTNTIEGVTKYVYCSQAASEEIEEPPTSWNFYYTS